MSDFKISHAELTVDEICDVTEAVLEHTRGTCGERINARSIDLRLWAAAALINAAFKASIESRIRASLEEKLRIMADADARTRSNQ